MKLPAPSASIHRDVTLQDVQAAAARIARYVRRTPLEGSSHLSEHAGADVRLKFECWQPTRSFKVRGAFAALTALADDARDHGVVTASAGNHGQAVALAARELGVAATIYVPSSAPAVKKQRIRALGAQLDEQAAHYDAAEQLARAHAARTGATFVHAYSDADVVAGQGTVGLELAEQLPDVATVLVPVGGGGLIAGVGTVLRALRPGVRIVGVQSERTHAMHAAFEAGRVVPITFPPTLADGLAGAVDEVSFARARTVVDEMVLVDEPTMAHAIRLHFERDGIVAEGSAAVGAAALLSGAVTVEGPVALIVTGGNIDTALLSRILDGSWTPA